MDKQNTARWKVMDLKIAAVQQFTMLGLWFLYKASICTLSLQKWGRWCSSCIARRCREISSLCRIRLTTPPQSPENSSIFHTLKVCAQAYSLSAWDPRFLPYFVSSLVVQNQIVFSIPLCILTFKLVWDLWSPSCVLSNLPVHKLVWAIFPPRACMVGPF